MGRASVIKVDDNSPAVFRNADIARMKIVVAQALRNGPFPYLSKRLLYSNETVHNDVGILTCTVLDPPLLEIGAIVGHVEDPKLSAVIIVLVMLSAKRLACTERTIVPACVLGQLRHAYNSAFNQVVQDLSSC